MMMPTANESRLRRAINLVIALALFALGGGGFVYLSAGWLWQRA